MSYELSLVFGGVSLAGALPPPQALKLSSKPNPAIRIRTLFCSARAIQLIGGVATGLMFVARLVNVRVSKRVCLRVFACGALFIVVCGHYAQCFLGKKTASADTIYNKCRCIAG